MINVINLSPFYAGMTLTLHRKLLFDSYVIFSSQMQITPDFIHILERLWRTDKARLFFFHSTLPSEKYCAIRANNITHFFFLKKRATYSWVQSSGVAAVVVTLALRVRAAVDSDSGAGGELVAAGAQRRVWRRRPGVQTAGQWAGCHQELLAQSKNNSRN